MVDLRLDLQAGRCGRVANQFARCWSQPVSLGRSIGYSSCASGLRLRQEFYLVPFYLTWPAVDGWVGRVFQCTAGKSSQAPEGGLGAAGQPADIATTSIRDTSSPLIVILLC